MKDQAKYGNIPEWLESMQVLDVKDGDVVVLRHKGQITKETQTCLEKSLLPIFKKRGIDCSVIVLEEGMDVGVLRKKSEDKI